MPRSPLVLLPGLLNTARLWRHQIEALSDVA
ncbi:MAG: alpha/beta hydrolase, partial [Reyranella sp.]